MADHTVSESWRPIPGYEGWYSVSDLGRVRRERSAPGTRPGLILKILGKRYSRVFLWRGCESKHATVHRLVAAAFLGPCPDGHEVNHIDGDKRNNRVGNLEYLTGAQNKAHGAAVLGNHRGARNPNAKLSREQAAEIKSLCRSTKGQRRSIAERFGVSVHAVNKIASGTTWPDL